jgi:biopolymer transport protein ExbB/TolQ
MERVKERELATLRRGLPVLATVSSSAPFVGLFGTVGGIITAFQKLADPTKGGGGIGTVSAGIAEALVTTAVGLGVAIISVWFYNYFIAKLDDMTIDIDETASEVVDSILRGQGG